MKTISILIVILFLSISYRSFSQEDIKAQILSYSDSTEMIIRNGRRLVTDKTIHGDSQGATETINYLKNNVSSDYVIFYPAEELFLSLANSNFDQFLFTAAHFNNFLEGKTKYIQVENITTQIQQFLNEELELIKKDLQRADLKPEDKEVLELYLRYYEGDDKYKLNKAVKSYRKNYPDSEYNSFLLLIQNDIAPASLNFCLGYGYEFLNGNMAKTFNSGFQSMNFELEWFIDQFYFSLFFQGNVGGPIHSTTDLPVIDQDLINTPDDDVYSIKYGIKLGKSWVTTRSINFFSYVSIGNYQMNPDKENFDIPSGYSDNLKLTSVFAPGIGTACDINLKRFKSKVSGENVGKWFIRPNVSYDFFVTGKEVAKGGSLFLNMTMGFGIGN